MKLSKNTIGVLRNFAQINSNLRLSAGNKQMTCFSNKTGFAQAIIEEEIPCQFCIYDLGELLGVLSIFNDPDLDFQENCLTISEGRNRIRYMPADLEVLTFPKNEPGFTDSPQAVFEMSAQQLQQIIKASSVLKAPIISFIGDGGSVRGIVHDKATPNSNEFIIEFETTSATNFQLHVRIEILKLMNSDYKVKISNKKHIRFEGLEKMYMLTGETDSNFE